MAELDFLTGKVKSLSMESLLIRIHPTLMKFFAIAIKRKN